MKTIDIMLVRSLCKRGLLKAYVSDEKIVLMDTQSGEYVSLGEAGGERNGT